MDVDGGTRRVFLATLARTGAGAGLLGYAVTAAAGAITAGGAATAPSREEPAGAEDVSPAEDLMREHGVLNRILLIYDESLRRLATGTDLPDKTLAGAAGIVRRFIEGYHEKLEEEHLFPRFERAGRLADLVGTLRTQHLAGRAVTAQILDLAAAGTKDATARRRLGEQLQRFIRMYRPHEAREDTVLFPALHELVPAAEYDRLGDLFEEKEHELFGARGFEGIVDQVAGLEKDLGIYDLAQFTPR